MMRRVGPLLMFAFLGALFVTGRLYKIQIVEHELWANEAAGILHSGVVLPPDRGRIFDATGAIVARDLETYRLVLNYREFRRGHPLGQIAHARSALEGRAVPLQEASDYLLEWAWDLVHLTPDALRAFAKGEPFSSPGMSATGVDDPRAVHRARRASDVRFYLRELLGLTPRRWSRIGREPEARDTSLSYLELASRVLEDPVSPERLWQRVEYRLLTADEQLGRLSARMVGPVDGEPLGLDGLVGVLESARRSVEDDAAAKLFREVFGFDVGRVDPNTLFRSFDLEWIGRLLVWEPARLFDWAERRRRGWRKNWLDSYAMPSVCADLVLKPDFRPTAEDFLDRLALLFAPEGSVEAALEIEDPHDFPSWRELSSAAVFSEIDSLFEAKFPRGEGAFGRVALPVLDEELRALVPPRNRHWLLVDRARNEIPPDAHLGHDLSLALAGAKSEEKVWKVARTMIDDWENGFQRELARTLDELAELAHPRYELDENGRLLLSRGRLDNVRERFDYLLKDFGTRVKPLQKQDLEYEVVHLVTRYQRNYPGIRAEEARVRHYPVLEGFDSPPFGDLVGNLSAVGLSKLQLQRAKARRLKRLLNTPDRDDDEEADARQLLESIWQSNDVFGVAGIEGWFDPELRGKNGFRESFGMKQALASERERTTQPIDGLDVHLTLDHRLQLAAQETLAYPRVMGSDPAKMDQFAYWCENPVGAIVVVSVNGDVIAAVSEPHEGSDVGEFARGQRRIVFERTLRIPTFQPPGSVFKPFVGAWGLESGLIDRGTGFECNFMPEHRTGAYGDVRCLGVHGLQQVDGALVRSCNSYFARLGEEFTANHFTEMFRQFGFYEPTGIRVDLGSEAERRVGARVGLREDSKPRLAGTDLVRKLTQKAENRQRAGNGLSVIEVTPMQLARATAGLATGQLPELRLVSYVGQQAVRKAPARPIEISESNLDVIRDGMRRVVTAPKGTARKALQHVATANSEAVATIGVHVTAKTGSADLTPSRGEVKIARKHTWVTGWFPADDPQFAYVVFLHDVSVTAGHSAIYVTNQFFRHPDTVLWMQEQGIDVDFVAREEGR